jgi:hypothetical protein
MKPVTPSGKLQGSCRCWIEPVITRHLVVAKIAPIPEIAFLDPALKGGICRPAGQKDVPIATAVAPAPARGVFWADQMITSAVLNGKRHLPQFSWALLRWVRI